MRARVKAEPAWGKRNTQEALREVGDSVREVFRGVESFTNITGMKLRPSLWGAGQEPRDPAAPAPAPAPAEGLAFSVGRAAGPRAGEPAQPALVGGVAWSHPPGQPAVGQPQQPPAQRRAPRPEAREDDSAMRRHCAALERLVLEVGLSPQAARLALRHLDSWLVEDVGRAEMAAAEAAAHGAGEAILHVGDQVVLEGLVKNTEANGMRGELSSYRAEDHRWKVVLTDGQVYWVRPKLCRPLEMKRLPLPELDAAQVAEQTAKAAPSSLSLAAAWAKLEARQAAWKEEQELRDIELLEREMALRKQQEALEAQEQVLGERRHTWALEQARGLAELEFKRSNSPQDAGCKVAASFALTDDSPQSVPVTPSAAGPAVLRERTISEGDEDGGGDDVWDMDWITLSPDKAPAPDPPAEGDGDRTSRPKLTEVHEPAAQCLAPHTAEE